MSNTLATDIVVDVSETPKNWISSLLSRFTKERKVLVEMLPPSRKYYMDDNRYKWRLSVVHPDYVCAELTNPRYNTEEKKITVAIEYVGHVGGITEAMRHQLKLVPSSFKSAEDKDIFVPSFSIVPCRS